MMKRGEVWLVELFTQAGREQIGTRPAVILADTPMDIAVIVPLTSNLKALRFPYALHVEPSNRNGLGRPSIALVFQIRAIDKGRLHKKIGELERSKLEEIVSIVGRLVGIK